MLVWIITCLARAGSCTLPQKQSSHWERVRWELRNGPFPLPLLVSSHTPHSSCRSTLRHVCICSATAVPVAVPADWDCNAAKRTQEEVAVVERITIRILHYCACCFLFILQRYRLDNLPKQLCFVVVVVVLLHICVYIIMVEHHSCESPCLSDANRGIASEEANGLSIKL